MKIIPNDDHYQAGADLCNSLEATLKQQPRQPRALKLISARVLLRSTDMDWDDPQIPIDLRESLLEEFITLCLVEVISLPL